MPSLNSRARRLQRQEEAAWRQKEYEKRSTEEQLALLEERRGFSNRERLRLVDRLTEEAAAREAAEKKGKKATKAERSPKTKD